ncbi:MAG: 3-deoxy-manno-octulosonate cytidylyltransferase [Ignavibacteria bacterium]
MKVTGVIPARYDSTRFPGKPLIIIKGKSMIRRVYEQSMKCSLLDNVIVATDDKRIYEHVLSFGGKAVMTSKKHKSGTDRINEAVQNIDCNIVVNIQGDEPYIDPKNIDKAVKPLLSDKKLNVSTLATRIKDISEVTNPNIVKVIFDVNGFAIYFSRGILPFDKSISNSLYLPASAKFYKHIGLYVYRKKFLKEFAEMKKSYLEETEKLEQLRILENGEKIKVVITNKDSLSVDTPEDLMILDKNNINTTEHLL